MYKVETAGDCYIVAGALMAADREGFTSLVENPDALQGADRVMAFSKVGGAGAGSPQSHPEAFCRQGNGAACPVVKTGVGL